MEFEALLSPRTRGFMPGRRQPGPLITTRTAHHYPDRSSLPATSRGLRDQTSQARKDLSGVPSFPYNACESRQKGTYSSVSVSESDSVTSDHPDASFCLFCLEDLVQVFWSAPASVTSEGRRRRTDLHSTS
ncbi:unnamed protein product [Gadus morhua 'NCC']